MNESAVYQCDYDLFLSLSSLERDRTLLETTGLVSHNVVLTEKNTGDVRILHLDIKKASTARGDLSIQASYYYQDNQHNHAPIIFFDLQTRDDQGVITFDQAHVMGTPVPLNSETGYHLQETLRHLVEKIAHENDWLNFVSLFEEQGLAPTAFGRSALPGLYQDGELKSAPKQQESSHNFEPVYPAQFLAAFLGSGPDYASGHTQTSHSLPLKGDNSTHILRYAYAKGATNAHLKVFCELINHEPNGTHSFPLYSVETEALEGEASGKITALSFHHPNAQNGMDHVDLSDPKAVAAAAKTMRMINRTIRAGAYRFKQDVQNKPQHRRLFLPSDIMLQTGLTELMIPKIPGESPHGRTEFYPVGGQGTRTIFSEYDRHIGANTYLIRYLPPGETSGKLIGIDMGIRFHDVFKHTFINLSPYLQHRYDKSHSPAEELDLLLFTHGHADHMGALAQHVRSGYILPPMVMKESVYAKFRRDLTAYNVPAELAQEALESCYVLEPSRDINPSNLDEIIHTTLGKKSISRQTEAIMGEKLGHTYYPVLSVERNISIGAADIPHSDPEMMYAIRTPAGTHLHSGDYKLDDSILVTMTPFWPWLKASNARTFSADSTGSLKPLDEKTITEATIRQDSGHLMKMYAHKRINASIIGSNVARLNTLIATTGDIGRKYLIIDGKAIYDTARDQDKINNLKKWAEKEHGVTVVFPTQKKEIERILTTEDDSDIVILRTGTQDEIYSSLNRGLRDWLPDGRPGFREGDVMINLQGVIPIGENKYRREGGAYYAEHILGMDFLLPESVKQEHDLHIAGSGHVSPADQKLLYKSLPGTTIIPVHGSLEQLTANARIAESAGNDTLVLHDGEGIALRPDFPLSRTPKHSIEMIGTLSHAKPEEFWNMSNLTHIGVRLKPVDTTPTGRELAQFEQLAKDYAAIPAGNEAAEYLAMSLAYAFNMTVNGGYLSSQYPFGVEKYGKDVFTAKRIGAFAAADTETTGTNATEHIMTQMALVRWNIDRKQRHTTVLYNAVPTYHTGSPGAYLVTDTAPEETHQGVHPVLFAQQIVETLKETKAFAKETYKARHPDDPTPQARVKTLLVWHNTKFDDRFIQKTLGYGLYDRVRPHATDGVISIDTRNIARALYAGAPNALNFRINPESQLPDLTLQALCEENGIAYDLRKAHKHADYDAERAMYLFWKMYDKAPEICAQMIMNSDSATHQLLNDMRGVDTGLGDRAPYPVFSYLSPSAKDPHLKIGCLIGVVGGGQYAAILDLSKDPRDLLDLPTEELERRLRSFEERQIELINLRQQPIVLPARYYLKQNTGLRKPPRELIERRAGFVQAHLNYVDPNLRWENIETRLNDIYSQTNLAFFQRSENASHPDLEQNLTPHKLPRGRHPVDTSNKIRRLRASASFNKLNQRILPKVKAYREAACTYFDSDNELNSNINSIEATTRYRDLVTSPHFFNEDGLQIHLIQYDIDPDSLAPADRQAVENYQHYQGLKTATEAAEELGKISASPDLYHRLIGNSRKKKVLLNDITAFVLRQQENFPKGNQRARKHLHPWYEQEGSDNSPDLAA